MRAAIYARYSSNNQRDASIEDQIEVCRRYIARQDWQLLQIYEDRALSGSSTIRPGYQKMLIDAESQRFDVIVVEALDRLGRNLADIASLHDRLSFAGIRLDSIATGEITPMHVGMLGTMAQMYLSDLREKTKRGQLGRALQGRIPGGKAYAYDVVEPANGSRKAERGERRINEAQAAIVHRIFETYAGGMSPRAIAKQLNAESISGPIGRAWRDTTIRGQVDRGTGILNNALYVGRLEWNRCSYVKNPRTGKRVARPNPRQFWEVVEVPDLRIIPDKLWEQVKARQKALTFEIGRTEAGQPLNRAHRRQFLLSGLLKCGVCDGGYTIMGKDRYGCATRRTQGICRNDRTIKRQEIEARVLAGLKDRLMSPDLVAAFMEEYRAEINRAARDAEQARAGLVRQRGETERKINGILRAIEDGMYSEVLKGRMAALEARRAEIGQALAAAESMPPVRLHPNLTAIYRDKVARLEDALNDDEIRAEAAEILRALIDRIELRPRKDDRGLDALLYGDLATILSFCEGGSDNDELPGGGSPGSQLSVVAGARNRLYLLLFAKGIPRSRHAVS